MDRSRARNGQSVGHDPRGDSGVAMIVVVGVVVVMFALVTMVVFLVNFATGSQARQELRVREIHLADAGINAYLSELRRDPAYLDDPSHLVLGPVAQGDGQWLVRATLPTATTPLTLRSEGRLSSQATSRTVLATVRFPTFADYVLLSNSDIRVGQGTIVRGRVRTNRSLNNEGTITGASVAGGSITGGGVFGPAGAVSKLEHQPTLEFAAVLADLDSIRTAAMGNRPNDTYLEPLGQNEGLGYRITLSGARYTVEKVTGVEPSGRIQTQYVKHGDLPQYPQEAVLFAEDDIWLGKGDYSVPCTIAGSRNVYVTGDIERTQPDGLYPLGIIAAQNIIVPMESEDIGSSGTTTTVTAALLAQGGSIYGNIQSGRVKPVIKIKGSLIYNSLGYFTATDPTASGFGACVFQYDPNLENFPPPYFPRLKTGSLRVNTWVED